MNRPLEPLIAEPQSVHSSLAKWGGTLVFLALDPFMAWPMLGLCDAEQILVICWDDGPAADLLRDCGIEVLALGKNLAGRRSTDELLQASLARARILRAARLGPVGFLAFKPSARLEGQIARFGFDPGRFKLLAAPARISRGFENKLRFPEKISGFDAAVPRHELVVPCELEDSAQVEALFQRLGRPFLAQFGAGYSGLGTTLIHDRQEWQQVVAPRPSRKLRITRVIRGRTLTINACVTASGQIGLGHAMEQLTGWPELTPYEFGSCGNVWNPSWLSLSPKLAESLAHVTYEVGRAMAEAGFLGHFGIDGIVNEIIDAKNPESLYVLEVNPRLTANVPVDTLVSRLAGEVSMVARHVLSHLGLAQGVPLVTEEKNSLKPVVSEWIVRHAGDGAISASGPWVLIKSAEVGVPVVPSADLGLGSDLSSGLFVRAAPGRDLKAGAEIGRLILPAEITDSERPVWLKALKRQILPALKFSRT